MASVWVKKSVKRSYKNGAGSSAELVESTNNWRSARGGGKKPFNDILVNSRPSAEESDVECSHKYG